MQNHGLGIKYLMIPGIIGTISGFSCTEIVNRGRRQYPVKGFSVHVLPGVLL